MNAWTRKDVKLTQEFGNTLVALGLLKAFFCYAVDVDALEYGCKCGYCSCSRTMITISYITNDGRYFEDEAFL